ncbi:MAG TPA: hypothetical protein PLT00_14985 [Verrucomicrobiota bacterium]|nr:MAG: hypothetical protein BWY09_01357 [Candidatus Hydrogenedentes bacterium ADurb.Bin179]HPY31734.1 hypothetical protein [Verrucomicrobiota bacterium]HQB18004.1 hypothetical protein [Verrucomicrobiota bacterium]
MQIGPLTFKISGRLPRIACLKSEYYQYADDPADCLQELKRRRAADVFTFVQRITEATPQFDYPHLDWDELAVLRFTSYEDWWKNQINDKTRNMVRKAAKKGIEVRTVDFNGELITGIKSIYDEFPLRQGKLFKHYGKDFATLYAAHESFLERSEFIGAYLGDHLVGFIKLVFDIHSASIMQIISMFKHRDKAPTNALLAKAVEICAARDLHMIHYGIWSERSIGDFKKHHGFERHRVPRYYVPINWRGRFCLRLKLHRPLVAWLPQTWFEWLLDQRARYYFRKYGHP